MSPSRLAFPFGAFGLEMSAKRLKTRHHNRGIWAEYINADRTWHTPPAVCEVGSHRILFDWKFRPPLPVGKL
jgi:hypothetical protein